MTYVPQVGDTARVVIVGPVTQYDPATGQTKVGNAQVGSVNFLTSDTIVTELEKVLPPESWKVDDVVLSADERIYRRTRRGTWQKFNGEDVFDTVPVRPLTLLVRDGQPQ
jgi:hypothetical protein